LFQASLLLKFVQMFFFSHFVGGCHFNDLRHLNEIYFGAGGQKKKKEEGACNVWHVRTTV